MTVRLYFFYVFQLGNGIKELYIESVDNKGEARLLWRLEEAPSEQPWHEGQVQIKANGEDEFKVMLKYV